MPLDFAVGPRYFRLGARNNMYNNTEMLFLTTKFIKMPFRAPSLKSKRQTLRRLPQFNGGNVACKWLE